MRSHILKAIYTLLTLMISLQAVAAEGDWPHYGSDKASTKYSPLSQINEDNVTSLEVAWRWESVDKDVDQARAGLFKCTPIVVDGVMYASTPVCQVAAINPGTGETLWVYDPKAYESGRPANTGFVNRGVDYYANGEKKRIFITTGDRRLISIDAETGKPDPDFGKKGIVDLSVGLGDKPYTSGLGFNAPPVICRDTIIFGSIITDFISRKTMPPGHIRGFDVHTGKQKWIFHTIPQEGEFGNETWLNDSWKYTGNTNAWSMLSADEELGYVYLPIGTPTSDYYGEMRHGANLFAESLVCLNAETGERVWHFQGVHHGLWDYDFPAAPNLVDITVDGKAIKAVAQVSKQGFTYVFDRVTGEPVWPIEERPVPQTTIPGEWTSPTQPFPTKPKPFERQGVTEDDLIDFTPELFEEAKKIVSQYTIGPLFTPPTLITDSNKGTLVCPGAAGGANWMGACVDPETGIMYVPSMTMPIALGLRPAPAGRSDFTYGISGADMPAFGPQGLPLTKPPYGRITAIDLNSGDHVWQIAHGEGPRNHPALKDLNLPPLGAPTNGYVSNGGGVVTKTLLFMMQPDPNPKNPFGQELGSFLRAFRKSDGEKVWEHREDVVMRGTPMTYMHEGKQYIAIAAGGLREDAELIAFRLP